MPSGTSLAACSLHDCIIAPLGCNLAPLSRVPAWSRRGPGVALSLHPFNAMRASMEGGKPFPAIFLQHSKSTECPPAPPGLVCFFPGGAGFQLPVCHLRCISLLGFLLSDFGPSTMLFAGLHFGVKPCHSNFFPNCVEPWRAKNERKWKSAFISGGLAENSLRTRGVGGWGPGGELPPPRAGTSYGIWTRTVRNSLSAGRGAWEAGIGPGGELPHPPHGQGQATRHGQGQ